MTSKRLSFCTIALISIPILAAMATAGETAREQLAARGLPLTAVAYVERAGTGDLEAIRLYLEAGMAPDAPTSPSDDGVSAIYMAALNGHARVVEHLLQRGVDIDSAGPNGSTALMGASLGGHGKLVAHLLDRGADVHRTNYQDQSALTLAALAGHAEIARTLLAHGADPNARAAYGQTPLIFASTVGSADTVHVLLQHGAQANSRDQMTGGTALDRATDPSIIRMLRDAGGKKASELR